MLNKEIIQRNNSDSNARRASLRFSDAGAPLYLLIFAALANWALAKLLADEFLIAIVTAVLAILGMWFVAILHRLRSIARAIREEQLAGLVKRKPSSW